MSAFNWDENEAVENKMISRSIESAQSKVEAYHFEIRKTLVDYDDVMNTQRDVIYKLRDKGLFGDNLDDDIHNYLEEEVDSFFENYDELDDQDNINKIFFLRNLFPEEYTSNINLDDLNKESLILDAKKIYETRRETLNEEISKKLDSSIFIHSIDSKWVEHLTVMDNMRQSIGLEAIGQRNPLIQYKKMGFEMFSLLVQNIKSQIVSDSIRVSNIQNKSNQNYKTQKQDFEQTRQNMTSASNSVNQSNNSNLSRQERRRLERLNKKTNKKRK